MGTATATPRTVTDSTVDSILQTGNSTIEWLQSALSNLGSIEGCLFGEPADTQPGIAREGIEARSAQASELAYELNERVQRIYNRL